jgi:iron(III) transport system permease protein
MIVALLLAALCLYSLGRVLVGIFVRDGQLDLSTLATTFQMEGLGDILLNTALIVGGSGLIAIVVGGVLAWLNERTDARMGAVSDGMQLLPFIVPPVASTVGWVMLFSPNAGLANVFIRWALSWFGVRLQSGPFDIFSMYGMILAYAVFMAPIVFLLVSSGLRNLDPALEEQSRVCGSGTVRTFFRVTLAALRPTLGGSVLLVVWFGCAMVSVPSILGGNSGIEVLAMRIVRALRYEFPPRTELAAGLCLFIVVAVGTTWYLQGRITAKGRHATVGGRGFRGERLKLGRRKWPVRAGVIGYLAFTAVMPVFALTVVALNGFWSPNISWGSLSLDTFREVLLEERATQRSLRNSLQLGVLGATLGVAAATILALYVKRAGTPFARVLEGSVRLPAALSGLVLAVGVLLAFSGPPFYLQGTIAILLIAYVILYMPQASVAADAAAHQVGNDMAEAAKVAGASGWYTFFRVQLPLMAGGLVAGWAMLFVIMTGEFQASALLTTAGNETVGFKVLETFNNGSYAQLAALALVLTAITTTVVVVVVWLTARLTRFGGKTTPKPTIAAN